MTRECQVLVAGGGSAGLAAAVASARAGARTVLVERGEVLGGAGTQSLVHTFCGLHRLAEEGRPPELANGGFPAEMAERMERATGQGPVRMGRVWVLPQEPAEFACIAANVVAFERNLEVLFGAEVSGIEPDGDGWRVETGGRQSGSIRAQAVVDATGDAVLAALLAGGGSEEPGNETLQCPGYIVGISGVEGELGPDERLRLAQRIVEGVKEGRLGSAALGVAFRERPEPGKVWATLDLEPPDGFDPTGHASEVGLRAFGRRMSEEIVAWLRESEPAWRQASVTLHPSRLGVRESRRWRGRHVLSAEEWHAGLRFVDEAALAAWPMEFRRTARGPKLIFPESGAPCGIPMRCLQAADRENLWFAGRCISVDQDVQASIRVMGTCFATGEAAGRGAAEQGALASGRARIPGVSPGRSSKDQDPIAKAMGSAKHAAICRPKRKSNGKANENLR
jgi:hypothetical protein